jgi:hypothetical protein
MKLDVLTISREVPDTARAREFDGEAMVQSFTVPLPGGGSGRAWITTAEALAIPGFGRPWVCARLTELLGEVGDVRVVASLATGLRLRSGDAAPRATPELAHAA